MCRMACMSCPVVCHFTAVPHRLGLNNLHTCFTCSSLTEDCLPPRHCNTLPVSKNHSQLVVLLSVITLHHRHRFGLCKPYEPSLARLPYCFSGLLYSLERHEKNTKYKLFNLGYQMLENACFCMYQLFFIYVQNRKVI